MEQQSTQSSSDSSTVPSSFIAKAAQFITPMTDDQAAVENSDSDSDNESVDSQEEKWNEAIEFWRSFGLDDCKTKLDKLQIEISENTAKSVASRKKLAVDTKQFRKIKDNNEEKLKRMPPLLRSYQEEIDSLTKRARHAEKAFLDLYRTLYEAPDPSPFLDEGVRYVNRVEELEDETEQLREELEENEREFAKLQNQDITIRKLEAQIEEERRKATEKLDEALRQKETEVLEDVNERVHELKTNEDEHRKEVLEMQSKISEQQSVIEKSQEELFELRSVMEENEVARQAELDLLAEELQRANNSVSSLELELEQFQSSSSVLAQSEDKQLIDDGHEQDRKRVIELEDELIRKHELEDKLRLEIKQVEAERISELDAHHEVVVDLEKTIKATNEELFDIKVKLNARPTKEAYDKLKAQLRMLQAIDEGGQVDYDDDDVDEEGNNSDNSNLILFHGRIRKLEATSTDLRVKLDACQKELETALREKSNTEERLKDQYDLINRLESNNAILSGGTSSTVPSGGPVYGNNQLEEQSKHKDSNMAAGLLRAATEDMSPRQFGGPNTSSESLFGIVNEQRNEFRKRMLELETERDSLLLSLRESAQDVESLRSDNVNLFEKIKYLQNYNAGNAVETEKMNSNNQRSEMRLTINGRNRSGTGSNRNNNVETKYKNLYEDKMNPFMDFNQRERRKRYKGLNAAEKITLNVTNFFLSNKYTRSFVFFYAITLHLLVFLTLFSSAHTTASPSDHQHMMMRPQPLSPQISNNGEGLEGPVGDLTPNLS